MTRDERVAIQALSQEPTDENLHREREQAYMQGYEDASKRFRQEPCDDVVSRQAVLNAIEHEDKWLLAAKGHNGLTEIAFSGLKARVDALPSVTPSRGWEEMTVPCENCGHDMTFKIAVCGEPSRHKGRWIYRTEDKYSCSKCGTTTRVDEAGIDEKPMYKFCPYCGRRMESEDKE